MNKGKKTPRNMKLLIFYGLFIIGLTMVVSTYSIPQVAQISEAEQETDWVKMSAINLPKGRGDSEMAYDSESGVVILYGGAVDDMNDTWAYNYSTNNWTNMNVSIGSKMIQSMAYDSESDRIILFGGSSEMMNLIWQDETWAYDYNTNTWENMNPISNPPARGLSDMVYDSESDRIILFGGIGTINYDDTWIYDYNSNTWTEMNPVDAPSARAAHSMAYNSKINRTLLFGGGDIFEISPTSASVETWEYDYNSNTWLNKEPSSHPPGLFNPGFEYDVVSEKTILFCGEKGTRDKNTRTWVYDHTSNKWLDVNSPSRPYGVSGLCSTYESNTKRVLSFGGETASAPLKQSNQMWAYEYQQNPPSEPRNLVASAEGNTVTLTWDHPATDAGNPITSYHIYRGPDRENLTHLADVGLVFEYTDKTIASETVYYYAVCAENSIGEGSLSSRFKVTTDKPTPGFSAIIFLLSVPIFIYIRRKTGKK